MNSNCCNAETYLKTSIYIEKENGKIKPFRNHYYCSKCNRICLFKKEVSHGNNK